MDSDDEDDIAYMYEMLKRKRARDYGISVDHFDTEEFEEEYRETIWDKLSNGLAWVKNKLCAVM